MPSPLPGSKRVIYVPTAHRQHLQNAVQYAVSMAAGAIAADLAHDMYRFVKSYLSSMNVPHTDKHLDPADVPDNHHYWHH